MQASRLLIRSGVSEDREVDRRVVISVERGKPLQWDPPLGGSSETRNPAVARVVATLKRRREEGARLCAGKYKGAAGRLPRHFHEVSNIVVVQCSDAILVRYERSEGDPWVRCLATDDSIINVAPRLSEGYIHFAASPDSFEPSVPGPTLSVAKLDAQGVATEIVALSPVMIVPISAVSTELTPQPPPPKAIASITNEIELHLGGEVAPAEVATSEISQSERFVGRAHGTLNVGWRAIEIFPLGTESFAEEFAAMWAEADLLAAIQRQSESDARFHRLDGRGESRERYAQLLRDFASLLDGPEEPVHQFLKRNRELISPNSTRQWSKLQFGKWKSDFVFLEAHDDYLLVEIEAPYRELFRIDGQPRQELTHAINQLSDWTIHLQDNKDEINKVLPGISVTPRMLIVIGRSQDLSDENRRKLTALGGMIPRLRIMTYDDLLVSAKATVEHFFGPIDLEGNMEFYFYDRGPADRR